MTICLLTNIPHVKLFSSLAVGDIYLFVLSHLSRLTRSWHDWIEFDLYFYIPIGYLSFVKVYFLFWIYSFQANSFKTLLNLYFCRYFAELEKSVVSVERVKEYQQTEIEAPFEKPLAQLTGNWPEFGKIEFDNFKTRYRKGLDLVLKGDLCCLIKMVIFKQIINAQCSLFKGK